MIRKLLVLVAVVAIAHAITTAGGPLVVVIGVLLWCVEGWVVLRAWPSCREDVRHVLALVSSRLLSSGSRKGGF